MPSIKKPGRRIALIALTACTAAAAAFLPWQSGSVASETSTAARSRVELPNYDIRQDKSASAKLSSLRAALGVDALRANSLKLTIALGEQTLRDRIPSLKIERNAELKTPEVIAADIQMGGAFLTAPTTLDRPAVLRAFLRNNSAIIGADKSEIDELRTVADYKNPEGGMSFVKLAQEIDGIPVFRGEISAGFTKKRELVRIVNNIAPGVSAQSVSKDFGDPSVAVFAAALSLGVDGSSVVLRGQNIAEDKVTFGDGDSATTAEKMYFPTEPGVVVPAWRVLVWLPSSAFYVIVDAAEGNVLWRKNLTEDQTQSATFSVYTRPGSMLNIAANPFPLFPGPTALSGAQGAGLSRSAVTFVGNEAPYGFNNLGWLNDGATTTDGNAVQAGIDRDGTDGIDNGGEAVNATRDFTYVYNPLNPNTNTGQNPIPVPQTYPASQFQQGALTQLFYITNRFHDETYRLGFNEAAGNFQNVNFTEQGVAGDRLRAEGQDSLDVNNANFTTPADGGRGKMQMYIFAHANPDVDGSLDASVVLHELTHGLSSRLHGNSAGLFNDMSRGMGEGWSDFYALSMLSSPSDDPLGTYAVAGYATYMAGGSTNNNYYGIRRFPTAVLASTGGAMNRPHNPLTFADIDLTQINIEDGAFEPQPMGGNPDAVHRAGEIWCNILWEVRHRFITRLGWEAGNRRMLQFVTDGMKLAPISPTYLSERDAIIAATFAGGTAADLDDMWAGFASRGLGAGASIQDVGGSSLAGGTGRTRVTEAFNLPNLKQEPNILADDTTGDKDGFIEPGETIRLTIPITNATGRTAENVTLQVTGGGSAAFGTLPGLATASEHVTFTVPVALACNSVIQVELSVNSSFGPVTFTRQIFVGKPVGPSTFTQNFDTVTAPSIPAGWTATAISGGVNFVTTSASPDTVPNALFTPGLATVGGGTDLTSPLVAITDASASVTFRNNYNTEEDWDGGVLEISIAGSPFEDILAAGGTFVQNGYNGTVGPGTNNPIANRAAWSGNSGGYVTTIASMPASAIGKVVQLKWRFGADNNTPNTGWSIDTIQLAGAGFVSNFVCSLGSVSVAGTLLGPGQLPVRNAPVTIIDRLGLYRWNAISGPAGDYKFPAIPRGDNYTIRVNSKRYRFPARNVSVANNSLAGIDLTGQQ